MAAAPLANIQVVQRGGTCVTDTTLAAQQRLSRHEPPTLRVANDVRRPVSRLPPGDVTMATDHLGTSPILTLAGRSTSEPNPSHND